MLEVAKVVGNFLKYSCSLFTEHSNHIAEGAWTGPHMLQVSAVLVVFMLKSDDHWGSKSCHSSLRLFDT